MAQNSTGYPFMGEVAGERAGILTLPAVETGIFVAPTETFSHLSSLLASTTMGTVAMIGGGMGYMKYSLNGTTYRVPVFTNA